LSIHLAGFTMAIFFDDGILPGKRPMRMPERHRRVNCGAEHGAFASQASSGLVHVMHCGAGMHRVET
jgi:hypothetical protein